MPIIAAAAAAKEGLRNLGDLLLLRFPNSLAEEEEESSLIIGAESFARKKKFPSFRESLFPNLGKGERREGQEGGNLERDEIEEKSLIFLFVSVRFRVYANLH